MKTYTFHYDLSMDRQPATGTLTFAENGIIRSEIEGNRLIELNASQVKEALVKAGVGCGLLYVKYKDSENDRVLCRFTMSGLKAAGDFCKIVNYYIQTGVAAIPDEVEKRVCEKCGRPMMAELNVCVFCYDKMSVLIRAVKMLKPFAKKIILSQSFLFLSLLFSLSIVLIQRYLIDKHFEPQIGTLGQIGLIVGAMVLARTTGELLFIINSRIYNKVMISYCNNLRVMAYDKLQSHSMSNFAKHTPGDLIRRIMEDTGTVRDFVTDLGRWAIEQIVMFVVVFIILIITNWKLTLLVFVPVPFVMFFLSKFWSTIRARYARQWRKSSKVNSILHDIIKGIRTVKAFGNEKAEIKKFADVNYELAKISSENEVLWARVFPLVTFLTGIGHFMILLFGGYAVINNTMTLGTMLQFTTLVGYIYGPLQWLVSLPRWLANATTSMVKVFEVLDEEPEIAEQENPKNVPISGSVTFEGVNFGYKSYEPVLKGIDLKINPGEMIGLVGKSGVGKSTLINLVMRLYDPNTGSVKINDTDLRDISPKYLHENIGVVFQDSFLFAGTFYENIIYAKPDATYEEVIAAAKAANAHDFIVKSSDGYNTLIGEGGESISGGERQRLSIARAIIKNPEILILDEATSSLDVETESAIQDSLNKLVKGRTTIAIAHRLSTLRNADRLVVLDKGAVAEVGTHAELLRKKGIYYNLVMAQRQSSKKTENEQNPVEVKA